MQRDDNRLIVFLTLCALLLGLFGLLFGDNIVLQITGRSIFEFIQDFSNVDSTDTDTEVLINMQGDVWTKSIAEPFQYTTHTVSSKNLSNFSLGVDIQIEGDLTEFHGLVFHQQDSKSFYSFRINLDGAYSLDLWFADETKTLTHSLGSARSSAIFTQPGSINYLKVTGKGGRFEFFINGTSIASISDDTLKDGTVGFMVCTCEGGNNVSVTFMNVFLTSD